jgi:predicted  nucleic acid-binding Zn-ribbon protein
LDGIQKLLILQDHDRKIIQLNREITDNPKRKEQIQARLENHQAAVHEAHESIKRHGLKMKELEGEVAAIEAKIARFREQQMTVKSNDDYRALEREIALARRQIKKLEDQELALMEELEELNSGVARREIELRDEGSVVAEELQALDQRMGIIQGEIDELKAGRPDLAAGVDSAWLSRYERILNHLGDFALVGIERGICMGCHMQLPPQHMHDVRKGDALTTCSFCGRILFDVRLIET